MTDTEILYPKKSERVGNEYPVINDNRLSPDRESMLYKYQNSVSDVYAGDFRIYVKKFEEYLKSSKAKVYDPIKNKYLDVPVRYSAPQTAFSDNVPVGSTGAVSEASISNRIVLPLVSFYLAGTQRDNKRAVSPCARARFKPVLNKNYTKAWVTHSPIPIDIQFQVDIWTEFREHLFQLITAFYHDFNPISYLTDVYDIEDETEKLQYTPYVAMYLDSVTDSSNFIPGSDRRVVRGTVRITVKGWLTPHRLKMSYVHNTISELGTGVDTEINNVSSNRLVKLPSGGSSLDAFRGPAITDISAALVNLDDADLVGATVEEAITNIASLNNVKSSIVLAEPLPAFCCFKLVDGLAYRVTSTSNTLPTIDGITLESGGIGSTVLAGKHLNCSYTGIAQYTSASVLYLSQTGLLTEIRPSSSLGDNYLVIVGRGVENTSEFIYNPNPPIRIN